MLDVRPGGAFRVTTVNDEDGGEMTNEGTYTEVEPPERLAFGETVVTFTDLGDGRTEMTFHTTTEADVATLRARMPAALESAFERLDEITSRRPMSTTTTASSPASTSSASRATTSTTARAFYDDVLGLEASSVWQRPGEPAVGAEFETGTVTIALINCPGLGIPFSPNPAPLALQVDDVAAARGRARVTWRRFGADTIDSGVCHMANFHDPDGNAIMLHQRYAPRAARPNVSGSGPVRSPRSSASIRSISSSESSKSQMSMFSLDPLGRHRLREHDVAELDVPAQDDLAGRAVVLVGDLRDRGLRQRRRPAPAGSRPR